MKPLLLTGFGILIYVEKRRLVVENKLKKERLEFYPHQIGHDSIIIDGHSGNVTFEAVRWLVKHNISLSMLNWNGELLSTVLPKEPRTGRLRISQYSKYLDKKIRYEIASEIVRQKVESSFNLRRELSRYYSELDIQRIEGFQGELSSQQVGFSDARSHSVSNVMGYEARVAAFYWENLSKVFNKLYPEFHFMNRPNRSYARNMNAADEINALLNYGYSILESETRKAINAVGLDPTIGFLHEVNPTRTALVYDVQELFRWLIDLSIIQLLEEKELKKSDFIITENYHIRLKEATARKLVERISSNFNTKARYKHGKNFAYQSILLDNVQELANFLIDKRKDLNFNIPFVRISRTDSLDITERILNMSPAERKRLYINKSTLWYQKKKLATGQSLKVYGKSVEKLKN